MAGVSLIDVLKEKARQARTGDDRYAKSMPYVFKLHTVPGSGSAGPTGNAYFPLPLNPESASFEWDFAAVATPCQDQGVIVEEGGIVLGRMSISAFTGMKLRTSRDTSNGPGTGKMTGLLGTYGGTGAEISGQLAAWRIVHRCFDAYGELKKDPQTASKTWMEFHGLKDRLHLMIVPQRMAIRREAGGVTQLGYRLQIECLIVGQAQPPSSLDIWMVSDNKSLLDKIQDSITDIRTTAGQLSATLDMFTAAADSVKRQINNITGIIDDGRRIVESANDFLNGVKSFIDIPQGFVSSLTSIVEAAAETAATASDYSDITEAFQTMGDQLDSLEVAFTDHYKKNYNQEAEILNTYSDVASSLTSSEKTKMSTAAASAQSAGGSMSIAQAFSGTGANGYSVADNALLTSEAASVIMKAGSYSGVKQTYLTKGDSLESLAVKHLGGAEKWVDIAVVNQLQSPFISTTRAPNTLSPGDPILIPVQDPSLPIAAVSRGNSARSASQIEEKFGRDFLLTRLTNGQWTWATAAGTGNADALTVRGINNLKQGLEKRLRWELGTVPSAPNVGLPRLVGEHPDSDAFAEAQFAIRAQIEADSRIARIAEERFEVIRDAVSVVINAVPIGYDTQRTMALQVT